MLSEEDTSLLLQSLYEGYCTLRQGKQRNGFFRKLTDEFALCCWDEVQPDKTHDAGQDAHMCACLFLHYTGASYVKYSARDIGNAGATATTDCQKADRGRPHFEHPSHSFAKIASKQHF